jgi:hypothetical protein
MNVGMKRRCHNDEAVGRVAKARVLLERLAQSLPHFCKAAL